MTELQLKQALEADGFTVTNAKIIANWEPVQGVPFANVECKEVNVSEKLNDRTRVHKVRYLKHTDTGVCEVYGEWPSTTLGESIAEVKSQFRAWALGNIPNCIAVFGEKNADLENDYKYIECTAVINDGSNSGHREQVIITRQGAQTPQYYVVP